MKINFNGLIILLTFTISLYGYSQDLSNKEKLKNLAIDQSMIPIRPGGQDQPFWNINSKRFINVPSFNFKHIDGAVLYQFQAFAENGHIYQFEASNPFADLSPIWKQLPIGLVSLKVEGIDVEGNIIDNNTQERKFYRAAVFKSGYHEPIMSYRQSALLSLNYLFNLDHYQNWITTAQPDTSYDLYCYPAKIISAVIESMNLMAQHEPTEAQSAMLIAENAAKYLISISEPKGEPLEYFPPTYTGNLRKAKTYKDQFMLIYPSRVALIYLDLFDKTRNKEYLNAAKKIADTYNKLQLPEGTWYLKMYANGEKVNENYLIPIEIIILYDRLENQFKLSGYNQNRKRAFDWILENPVKTWNWEAQFEDMEPTQNYKNLTKHQACSFVLYLLERIDIYPQYLELCKEITLFAEDQFVVWEQPLPNKELRTDQWITPCVLEQYEYYVPIDASAAKLIATFQKMYEVTKEVLYLAKAIELANTMTVAQDSKTGRYPTYWELNYRGQKPGWINCATYDAVVLLDLDLFLNR